MINKKTNNTIVAPFASKSSVKIRLIHKNSFPLWVSSLSWSVICTENFTCTMKVYANECLLNFNWKSKLHSEFWVGFSAGRIWPQASQVCCHSSFLGLNIFQLSFSGGSVDDGGSTCYRNSLRLIWVKRLHVGSGPRSIHRTDHFWWNWDVRNVKRFLFFGAVIIDS